MKRKELQTAIREQGEQILHLQALSKDSQERFVRERKLEATFEKQLQAQQKEIVTLRSELTQERRSRSELEKTIDRKHKEFEVALEKERQASHVTLKEKKSNYEKLVMAQKEHPSLHPGLSKVRRSQKEFEAVPGQNSKELDAALEKRRRRMEMEEQKSDYETLGQKVGNITLDSELQKNSTHREERE